MKITLSSVALLAFGLVALIGLIVLEATHNLADPTVRDSLTSITFGSLAAAAGVTIPQHTAAPAAAPDPVAVDSAPVELGGGGLSSGQA